MNDIAILTESQYDGGVLETSRETLADKVRGEPVTASAATATACHAPAFEISSSLSVLPFKVLERVPLVSLSNEKVINEGTFGTVYAVRRKNGDDQPLALKIPRTHERFRKFIQNIQRFSWRKGRVIRYLFSRA